MWSQNYTKFGAIALIEKISPLFSQLDLVKNWAFRAKEAFLNFITFLLYLGVRLVLFPWP